MEFKQTLCDKRIIKAIRQCASGGDCVRATYRAQQDMSRLDMTLDGVCKAIVKWIDDGETITQDLSGHDKHAGKFLYIMTPEIDDEKRYVKVQLDEETDTMYVMIVVSAHEYEQ
jgi:hypothetical protein